MTPADLERRALYHRIRAAVSDRLAGYYLSHPERMDDARGNEAQNASYDGLKAILAILDEYDVHKKPLPPPGAQT